MTKYINAGWLYGTLCNLWHKTDSEDFEKGVFETIINAPTADVVEVVRCKDCRSGYPEIENDNGKIEVYYYCDGDCCYHSGNDYCSDGERRDADV